MSPKGNQHEVVKTALTHYWSPRRPTDITFATETTFRFTEDTYLEPDFVFYPVGGLSELSVGTANPLLRSQTPALAMISVERPDCTLVSASLSCG